MALTPLQTRQAWEEAMRRLFIQPLQNVQATRQARATAAESALSPGPPPLVETGTGNAGLRRRKRRAGRADTILAGDLVPMDIGKRTLLG